MTEYKFEAATFEIRFTGNRMEEKKGYAVTYDGITFTIYKNGSIWVLSDILGYEVCKGSSRKGCMSILEERWEVYGKILKTENYRKRLEEYEQEHHDNPFPRYGNHPVKPCKG